MTKRVREELLKSIEDDNDIYARDFVGYINRHTSRTDELNLQDVIEPMSKKERDILWIGLFNKVQTLVQGEKYLAEHGHAEEVEWDVQAFFKTVHGADSVLLACLQDSPPEDMSPHRHRDTVADALDLLRGAAQMALIWLQLPSLQLPEAMLNTVGCLHSTLFQLHGAEGIALQTLIARVCEKWWTDERPGAELFVTQLLPFLTVKSLDEDAKEADIKRLYAIRNALLLLDFEDESIQSMKGLLLRCFLQPLFLKTGEGQRFLTFIFGLHPDFIDDIHMTILNQIPYQRKTLVTMYGQIYFKAWRTATGQYQLKLEYTCIQDIMNRCIHANSNAMFNNLRKALAGFHEQKRAKGVDEMLLRLYEPILWRSLKAANPLVRKQATLLMVDAFPLQNPDSSTAEMEALLQKQFDLLGSLLFDNFPAVRAVAVQGVCRIISLYWELIPSQAMKAFIGTIVGDLAFDKSSPAVRASVFSGIDFLLDNHLSHSVLQPLLPSLAPLIHDSSVQVRLAFVRLLLKIKRIRGLPFYRVVPVDSLLEQFSADAGNEPLVKAFTELFLNSYFPKKSKSSEQVRRCIAFIKKAPLAAKAFYGSVHTLLSVGSVSKMSVLLFRLLVKAVEESEIKENATAGRSDKAAGRKRTAAEAADSEVDDMEEESEDENTSQTEQRKPAQTISADDTTLVLHICGLMLDLLGSVVEAMKDEKHFTVAVFVCNEITGEKLQLLLSRYADVPKVRVALQTLMALLPENKSAKISEAILSTLPRLDSSAMIDDLAPMVRCLVSWGKHKILLKLIDAAFTSYASSQDSEQSQHEAAPKRKRPQGKDKRTEGNITANSNASAVAQMDVTVALRALDLLVGEGGEGEGKKSSASAQLFSAVALLPALSSHIYLKALIHTAVHHREHQRAAADKRSTGHTVESLALTPLPDAISDHFVWATENVIAALVALKHAVVAKKRMGKNKSAEVASTTTSIQNQSAALMGTLSALVSAADEVCALDFDTSLLLREIKSWLDIIATEFPTVFRLNPHDFGFLAHLSRFVSLALARARRTSHEDIIINDVTQLVELMVKLFGMYKVSAAQLRRLYATGSLGKAGPKSAIGSTMLRVVIDTLADASADHLRAEITDVPDAVGQLLPALSNEAAVRALVSLADELTSQPEKLSACVELCALVVNNAPKRWQSQLLKQVERSIPAMTSAAEKIPERLADSRVIAKDRVFSLAELVRNAQNELPAPQAA